MNIGLYQSAASLSALERWQDAVSQNITASQVTGFKKRTVEFSGIEMGELNPGSKAKVGDGQPGVFPKATLGVSYTNGETEPTKRELDIALEGDGFFKVKLDDGTIGYTRAGELHIKPDRTLVNRDGAAILSDAGNPITLLPQNGPVSINSDGVISENDTPIGKLAVVDFKDTSKLVPLGGGVFKTSDGSAPDPVAKPVVMQGYLEGSNVAPLREMISLVQIARAYEANQKMITSRDQEMQKTLDTLG